VSPDDLVSPDAHDVRDEDAFDVDRLHEWLTAHAPAVAEGRRPPLVTQFSGGASNLTYLLDYDDAKYVLRMPPHGHKASTAHDMGREVNVQRRLKPLYPLVPAIHAFCQDSTVIGSDFYVMDHVDGVILRRDLPEGVTLSTDQAHTLACTVIDAQADLHSIDPDVAGLADLGRGPGYVARQVAGWSRRYRDARTDDVPDAEDVMHWLDANQPDDVAARLIHGDWRFDNLVLDVGSSPRIVGVLDWEMATVGDPLMDVGASLAYWITSDDDELYQLMRRQPTNLTGMPSRDGYMARYLERTGLQADDWTFYEIYGLFRLAAIAQQIWFRYRRGETTNPAFAMFGAAVSMLVDRAAARLTA
jgi:aminoglycoside phosphotransferase (APT) family kinase protein